MPRITEVVKMLLIINVIIYFGTTMLPAEVRDWLVLYFPLSDHFKPVQLVTHMFNHGGPMHLFFNMFGLFMFGPPLETQWGPKKFLFFYLVCGFGAAALHILVGYFEYYQAIALLTPEQIDIVINEGRDVLWNRENYKLEAMGNLNRTLNVYALGASGALYGILVAYGMNYPNAKLALIFFPVPVAAKYFIPGLLLLDIIGGFGGFSIFSLGIAHFAHIGGALTGFLLIMYWRKYGSRL